MKTTARTPGWVYSLALAAVPWLSVLLFWAEHVDALRWVARGMDVFSLVCLVPPMLFWDAIGLIHWNVLGGNPKLLDSEFLAVLVYSLSSSVLFFAVGECVRGLWRLARRLFTVAPRP